MFGTGESTSSSSESTMPSWMSSSAGVGTYWRQNGSPGFWMRSSAAGVMRRLKRSMACSAASLSTFSSPKRATSSSTVVMLWWRMSCHLSMAGLPSAYGMDAFGEDHPIVARCVELGHACDLVVSVPLVEPPGGPVARLGRGLDQQQSCILLCKPSLHLL